MELGLQGRVVSICGSGTSALDACADLLVREGAVIADASEAPADIVVAAGRRQPGSDLLALDGVDDLYHAWDDVLNAVKSYRAALPRMLENQWGRFVWIGTAQAKSVDAEQDELSAIVSLGMLGLHKVVTGEVGRNNITANAVLRGGQATDQDVADTVAFLCSVGAGYLSGVTISVDGGAGSAVY
ncbi:hypothetical protein ACSMXN_15175 [Jatrophihabitans sp. DSM 45814]